MLVWGEFEEARWITRPVKNENTITSLAYLDDNIVAVALYIFVWEEVRGHIMLSTLIFQEMLSASSKYSHFEIITD